MSIPSSFLTLFISTFIFALVPRLTYFATVGRPDSLAQGGGALACAIVFDLVIALTLMAPLLLYSLIRGARPYGRKTMTAFSFFIFFLLSLTALSELYFMDEFHARFNFIAVDYLVYTNEVLNNIWQSYPIGKAMTALVIVCSGMAWWSGRRLAGAQLSRIYALAGLALLVVMQVAVAESALLRPLNGDARELAKNPIYAVFAAYRDNSIDYLRFYSSMETGVASAEASQLLRQPASVPAVISNQKNKPNVVLVLMESMSARFMRTYGSPDNVTPNLDRLTGEGLFFDHMYSTGTRTVRGIEAVTLAVPPTPGQSLVRRPEGQGVFNLGTVFQRQGYQTRFIYGGRAWFDNMQAFFQSSGFSVLDQTEISPIHFSNAWGVCDEDLFSATLASADEDYRNGRPFFNFVLTTSNHRPYTYPENKVDIPSGTGRKGALKYADFSIGQFLEQARTKPWFSNTIFLFVADHNAAVSGGTIIKPEDYRIPVIFYAPDIIKPQRLSMRGSQIDVGPTLLGLLGWPQEAQFFGEDLRVHSSDRAYLSTYQKVGYWRGDKMVILAPNREVQSFKMDGEAPHLERQFVSKAEDFQSFDLLRQAVALYQTASQRFHPDQKN